LDAIENLSELSTLIISRDDFLLTADRFNEVMGWVAQGGDLIIGYADEEGFLAEALHLSKDRISDAKLIPQLTTTEQIYDQEAREKRRQTRDDEDSDKTDCPPERRRGDRCRDRSLSERMRADNEAERLAFEARKAEPEETHGEEPFSVVQAWALDYAHSNKYTRTYLRFEGDAFDSYVDWDTNYTIIYDPPADHGDGEVGENGLIVPTVELVGQAGNDELAHFLQFDAGQGSISVLIHTRIWENEKLGQLDHAYFLWALLGSADQPVAVLHGRRVPSLWSLMLKFLPEVVLAAFCLLLAYFVRRAWRFGPRITTHYGVRRSLLEHVTASGVFLWEQQAHSALLDPLRRNVNHLLLVRMGHDFDIKDAKDWARITPGLLPKLNQSDRNALRTALDRHASARSTAGQALTAQEFYRQVKMLQALRKVL
jgi:hypothetical protein